LHVAGAEALSPHYCQFDVTTRLHRARLANAERVLWADNQSFSSRLVGDPDSA